MFNPMMKKPERKKLIKVFNIALWVTFSVVIFYRGSVNADMWGKWQGFEVVMPLVIAMFLSGIIVLVIILFEYLLGLHN